MKFTTSVAFAALTSLFITMGSASVVPAAFEKRADVCVPGGQTCSSIGPDCCEGFSCLVLGAEGTCTKPRKRDDVCIPGGQMCSSIGPDCCEGFSCLVLGAEGTCTKPGNIIN